MKEFRTIAIELPAKAIEVIEVQVSRSPEWTLVVSGGILTKEAFTASDLFEALKLLRSEAERTGGRVLCAGARTDAWPSEMSRQMGAGRQVYITRRGEQATELVDIFERVDSAVVGTVQEQADYHAEWLRSLEAKKN